jgi:hypothetical protein
MAMVDGDVGAFDWGMAASLHGDGHSASLPAGNEATFDTVEVLCSCESPSCAKLSASRAKDAV